MPKTALESVYIPAPAPTDVAALPTFEWLFRQHAADVVRLLRRLGVREADVEDVAQEVFVVAFTQLAEFEGRSTLKTWLCGIAVRKASQYRRKAYRRRERSGFGESEPSCAADQELALVDSERRSRLSQALAQLNEKQLQVFVLYEIEELSMSEVARAVGCPRFTAYTRLYSARRAMREFFQRTGSAP